MGKDISTSPPHRNRPELVVFLVVGSFGAHTTVQIQVAAPRDHTLPQTNGGRHGSNYDATNHETNTRAVQMRNT